MNQLLSSHQWHLLKYAESTEVVRQNKQIIVNVLKNDLPSTADENT